MVRRNIKSWKKERRSTKWKSKKSRTFKKVKKGTQSTAVAKVSYSSGTSIMAPKYVGKFRYRTVLTQPFGTTDIPVRQIYRATSIFDPDESKAGFQPSGHDEMKLFYNHYMVIGCRISVKAIMKASHVGNMYVFLSLTDDTTTTNRNTVTEMLNDHSTKRISIGEEKRQGWIGHYYSKNKNFGKTRDTDLTAAFGANPAENMYFQLSSVNYEAADQPVSINYEVTLEYTVLCTERKSIGTS